MSTCRKPRKNLSALVLLVGAVIALGHSLWASSAETPQSFDRLSEVDRARFAERFKKELWPLFVRGGKDGCVGCHHAKNRTQLRFTGDAEKDFIFMLRKGFLLEDDPGSVEFVVRTNDERFRMPPDGRPGWTPEEIKLLQDFVRDINRKQKR